ncbi:MAG: hypothetical protein RIT28_3445 [Pseudomonadota bacterium]
MRRLTLLISLLAPALTACAPAHCEVDGVPHNIGDTYPCGDGCNTCTCTRDGVTSTRLACETDTGGDDTDDASDPSAE